MKKRVYCTYFDHNYLARGLALYHSLQRHAPGSRLWVLCLSELCLSILKDLELPYLLPVSLEDFETADPEVAATKTTRKRVEYYFTCSPAWMLFVAQRDESAEWITYLDSDLFFYENPEYIYVELANASIAIIPHRYTPKLGKLRKFGIYNVGWVGARNNLDGTAAMKWWRERCIEWCYDYVDDGRFADQGYLDRFSQEFRGVKAIESPGANLAPWNIGNYDLVLRDGNILLDRVHPLIFFHFQGVRKGWGRFFFNSHRIYRAPFSRVTRNHIYKPYLQELLAIERSVEHRLPVSTVRPHRRFSTMDLHQYLKSTMRTLVTLAVQMLDIVTGRAFFIDRGSKH